MGPSSLSPAPRHRPRGQLVGYHGGRVTASGVFEHGRIADRHAHLVDAAQAQPHAQKGLRRLCGRGHPAAPTQVFKRKLVALETVHHAQRAGRVQAAEQEAVGKHEQVGSEPVGAKMSALPSPRSEMIGERPGNGTAAGGTAQVALAVGAGEVVPLGAQPSGTRRLAAANRLEVELEHLMRFFELDQLEEAFGRVGAAGQQAAPPRALGGALGTDEQQGDTRRSRPPLARRSAQGRGGSHRGPARPTARTPREPARRWRLQP